MTAALVASGAGRQRRQLVLSALVLVAAVLATTGAADVVGDVSAGVWQGTAASALLVPVAFAGGASARARRWGGRLLQVAAAAAAVAGALVLGLAVLVLVLGHLPDRREADLVWPVVAGLASAALAYPRLRRAGADAVRLRSATRSRTPDAVLDAFGDRAARDVPADELLLQLAEALRRDLRLHAAEVWTRSGDGLQRLLSVPHRPVGVTSVEGEELEALRRTGVAGEAWLRMWLPQLLQGRTAAQVRLAAARYGGELLALVLVERPRDGERFTAVDERRLGDVVGRLGLALHNRRLDSTLQATLDDLRRTNEELRASRSRLVAAADAERRRIERDIHDGAQQHLVALAVNLGLSRDVLRDDPAAAAELLAEMSADLKETIAHLRDLAHGIYPPLLRESGLAAALRAAAGRSPQQVSVHAGELQRYGPDVESAVYFCCLEALQNSAKHAPGAAVRLEVRQEAGFLRFLVEDDGPGFDAAAAAFGQGFQNMTDRLGAVGGTVSWESAPGAGARIEGVAPVPVPVVAQRTPVTA